MKRDIEERPSLPIAMSQSVVAPIQCSSPLANTALQRLAPGPPLGPPRYVALAPGRLDVMGGVSEYSGCRVLNQTTETCACVAVQRRADHAISISSLTCANSNGRAPFTIPLNELHGHAAGLGDAAPVCAAAEKDEASLAILGLLVEAMRAGVLPRFNQGLSFAASIVDGVNHGAADAAIAAATLTAVARMMDIPLDASRAIAVCTNARNRWLRLSVDRADSFSALSGASHVLNQVSGALDESLPAIPLPEDVVFVGLDSGAIDPLGHCRYQRARTAAFMGLGLVKRILEHESEGRECWNGYLSGLSVAQYVDHFRDRLPTKIKGIDYLERFGETCDEWTRIDPHVTYRIRSRTEHHIYEHARAVQFTHCLEHARGARRTEMLKEAGGLLFASHWSYGQRCGLGSVETDLLVNLIRTHGDGEDIHGAKISGRGCGGVVTVLMQATERASAAMAAIREDYRARSGKTAKLITGSSLGALLSGAQAV